MWEQRCCDSVKTLSLFTLPALPSVEAPQACLTSATAAPTPSHPAPPSTDPSSKSAAQSMAFLQEQLKVAQRLCGLQKSSWDITMSLSSNAIDKGW